MLKEPVLESRPRETTVEHADADQRARSNGVACSLQRHLDGREWVRVFAPLSRWSQSVPRCSHSESMCIPVTAAEFGRFGIGGDASTKAVAIETAGSIKNLPEV